MGTIGPINKNPFGDYISKGLYYGRDFANKVQMPYIGGFGDLLFGQSPEVIEEWSEGFNPIHGKGQAARLDNRMLDVAGLPLPYAGAYYGTKALGKKMLKETGENAFNPINQSRRNFLSNSGKAAIGAGLGLDSLKYMPEFAEGLTKGLAADAKRVAAATAPKVAAKIFTKPSMAKAVSYFRLYPHMIDELRKGGWKGVDDNLWRYNGPGENLTPELIGHKHLDPKEVLKNLNKDVRMEYDEMSPFYDEFMDDALVFIKDSPDILAKDLNTFSSSGAIYNPLDEMAMTAVHNGIPPSHLYKKLLNEYKLSDEVVKEINKRLKNPKDYQEQLDRAMGYLADQRGVFDLRIDGVIDY